MHLGPVSTLKIIIMKIKLVGFIPFPSELFAFGIPVYRWEEPNGTFLNHELDPQNKTIAKFCPLSTDSPEHMVFLPKLSHRAVQIGDPAVFAISNKISFFVGTRTEIEPHFEGIKNSAGRYFLEEFNSAFPE